jgi:aspartate--ammonia ligase
MIQETIRKQQTIIEQETMSEQMSEKQQQDLDFFDTQRAIKLVKETFEKKLAGELKLIRISAPKFLKIGTGLQDDLAGTQIPVRFKAKAIREEIEMVHSLAKWKRHMLGKHNFAKGTGLYTDMDAVRKDEDIDETHSIHVDQWDWEKVISRQDRTIQYLQDTVRKIYHAIIDTEEVLAIEFPQLKIRLPKTIRFVHTEELESEYPQLSPKEREHEVTKKFGAVFIIGIGHPLKSGKPHDMRAADYDDWSTITSDGKHGLDGDIFVWDTTRQTCLELSSMGIRVDKKALQYQLKVMGLDHYTEYEFHKAILEDRLPLSIGGGIGQSRLCMLLLQKKHIGEVQSSVWSDEIIAAYDRQGKILL